MRRDAVCFDFFQLPLYVTIQLIVQTFPFYVLLSHRSSNIP